LRARVWLISVAIIVALGSSALRAQGAAMKPSSGAEVVLHALGLLGAPYRVGGEDPVRGFDCSGLVRHVFRLAAGLDLPRQSEAMGEEGRPVAPEALEPGDLLFFNTLGRPFSHVALYIGEGRFVHAPTHGGQVRIESMQIPYWRARFNGARRVGPEPERASLVVEAPGREAESGQEPGWRTSDYKP
jgi:cell wall-associated NlpC family hydrolase